MQFYADCTKERLLNHPDPVLETHFSLRKLRTVAALLSACRPDLGFDSLGEDFFEGISHIVEDAANEIEYLIEISGDKLKRDRKQRKAAVTLEAGNS